MTSVSECSLLPTSVWVVDSSDDVSRSLGVLQSAVAGNGLTGRVRHVAAPAGLTIQRNIGVSLSSEDVVHFIDDDVVLERRYFEELMAAFEDDKTVIGATGRITNVERGAPPALTRLFMLDSRTPGAVLASGRCVLALTNESICDVDWLSGCSMSYRREVFGRLRFDEALEGYALGEDLEFSYRAAQRGRLISVPRARLEHLESGVDRWKRERKIRMELVHRYVRVRARVGRWRPSAFWWSAVGQLAYLAALGARDRSPQQVNDLRVALRAIVAIGRYRPRSFADALRLDEVDG
jgi:GT2 family glycosyltransferase